MLTEVDAARLVQQAIKAAGSCRQLAALWGVQVSYVHGLAHGAKPLSEKVCEKLHLRRRSELVAAEGNRRVWQYRYFYREE